VYGGSVHRRRVVVLGLALSFGGLALSARAEPSAAEDRVQLPVVLHAYTRQVQLGTLQAVVHPALALGVEYPYYGQFRTRADRLRADVLELLAEPDH
jgi:hypothetical protein